MGRACDRDRVPRSGLDALAEIDGSLYIEEATALLSLTGLEALAHVGVAVYVTGSGIVDVDGLSGLTTLDGYLDFEFNPALESLAGLSGLTEVPSDLLLYGNGALTSLTGLNSVTRAGSMLWVVDNDALTSLDGLSALTEVADDLHVSDNAALCDDEVDALLAQLPSFSADIYRDGNTGACP